MAALDLKQQLKLTQQLTMTPQLQQAIKILQLPRLELQQYLRQQMSENPVLEEREYGPEEPLSRIEQNTEEMMRRDLAEADIPHAEVDWELMARQKEALSSQGSSGQHTSAAVAKSSLQPPGDVQYEQVVSATMSLSEHLHAQLHCTQWPQSERRIAEEIIGNLTEKGYLEESTEALAQRLQVPQRQVEKVLKKVQACDPPGVAARDLIECLTLQMHEWKIHNPDLIHILSSDLRAVERRNYDKISKKLGLSRKRIEAAMALLTRLEPIPARAFISSPPPYITVDVIVVHLSGKWRVISHDEGLPNLKISPYYLSLIKSQKKSQGQDRRYLQDKIRCASALLKALQQRQSTVTRVSEVIVRRQHDFFEKGSHHLKPMVLKDVAREIDVHESTVSRVTAGKYMQTPRGIFELRYFFSSSLAAHGEEREGSISGESVRQMIKKIFAAEDVSSPLSDQKVAEMMALQGVTVARRTIAKYREQLGIAPSSRRKRFAS